jgi:hypothetical protein
MVIEQRKTHNKTLRTILKGKKQRGGAIYTFDHDDKIGGQPARISLNGTLDGDCPASETKDLGFVNYGLTPPKNGGGHVRKNKSKKMHKSYKSKKYNSKHNSARKSHKNKKHIKKHSKTRKP